MGDLMLLGVLRVLYNVAMRSELSRLSLHSRCAEAADRIEADAATIARLTAERHEARARMNGVRLALLTARKTARRLTAELEDMRDTFKSMKQAEDDLVRSRTEAAGAYEKAAQKTEDHMYMLSIGTPEEGPFTR